MIELRPPFKIEQVPPGDWLLILWEGDNCFDYTTPFRAMLAETAKCLGQENDLQLPAYEEGEDFVEGTLRYGNTLLGTYYEHSLNYLALTSDGDSILRDVAEHIQRRLRLA